MPYSFKLYIFKLIILHTENWFKFKSESVIVSLMMLKFATYCPVLSIPHTEQVFGFQNAAQWEFRMRHSPLPCLDKTITKEKQVSSCSTNPGSRHCLPPERCSHADVLCYSCPVLSAPSPDVQSWPACSTLSQQPMETQPL